MKGVRLKKGANPLLIRYDHAGRGHIVVRRSDMPVPSERQPLSMCWSNDKGVIPFDVAAGKKPAEWFRFVTAPGTNAIQVKALGKVEAWIDGTPMKAEKDGRFTISNAPAKAAVVALRIQPETYGITGGGLIPEPVTVETNGKGEMPLGDWSAFGILNNYSGGVCYATDIQLDASTDNNRLFIDLGNVAGTAEVMINGRKAGVKVAPPWKLDITPFLSKDKNHIEVLVYNTLANHYQTIPSRFRGNSVSGLMGPVKILVINNSG
jgi:hypothetical protein